jgi:hypothetical protein
VFPLGFLKFFRRLTGFSKRQTNESEQLMG